MSANSTSATPFDDRQDQRAVIGPLREFLRAEVAPGAAERDRSGTFPHELVAGLAELGLLGLQVPERWGGAGLDTSTTARVLEEIAAVDGSLCLTVASHNGLCVGHLLAAGSEAQKDRWLPALARGERLGAWALTEPGSGSDAAALRTRAQPDGDGFRLHGEKSFITQGSFAGVIVVLARSDAPREGRGRSDGISAFVVEGDAAGLHRGPPERKLGLKSSDTASLSLDGVPVPGDALLGARGAGFADVKRLLVGGRIGIAAMALGLGRAALEAAGRYALEREQFDRPLAEHQAVAFPLAEAVTDLEAARLLIRRAAELRDAGRDAGLAASMAKLKAARAGVAACDQAIQTLGGYGYLQDHPVERYWRDARLTRIGEGTDEVQQMVIARSWLAGLRDGP